MPNQKTVLIVDDQPSLRLLLRATLGKSGFRLLEAKSGAEALELAKHERPDLMFLDVGMPGMDGYAVCRALKADPETAAIKVIMLTARAQRADRAEGIAAGADGYLTKPFKPADLRLATAQLLTDEADAGVEQADRVAAREADAHSGEWAVYAHLDR